MVVLDAELGEPLLSGQVGAAYNTVYESGDVGPVRRARQ